MSTVCQLHLTGDGNQNDSHDNDRDSDGDAVGGNDDDEVLVVEIIPWRNRRVPWKPVALNRLSLKFP